MNLTGSTIQGNDILFNVRICPSGIDTGEELETKIPRAFFHPELFFFNLDITISETQLNGLCALNIYVDCL